MLHWLIYDGVLNEIYENYYITLDVYLDSVTMEDKDLGFAVTI